MTWKRVNLKVVLGYGSLIAIAAIIAFWKFGMVSEPGMVDEPLTVSVLRELATKAEQYKSAHPSVGYPSDIGELYHPQVDILPLQCGTITNTPEEICSLQSKTLPAEYIFTYRALRSEKSSINDGFAINADALARPETIGSRRHFRIDASGKLRVEVTKPADENSPKL